MIKKRNIHISYEDLQIDIEKMLFVISDFFDIKNIPVVITKEWRNNAEEIYQQLNELLLDDRYSLWEKKITLNIKIKKDIDNEKVNKKERELFENIISNFAIPEDKKENTINIIDELNKIRKSVYATLRNYFLGSLPSLSPIEGVHIDENKDSNVEWLLEHIEYATHFSILSESPSILINFLVKKDEKELKIIFSDIQNLINNKDDIVVCVDIKFKKFLNLFLPPLRVYVVNAPRERAKEEFKNSTFEHVLKNRRLTSYIYLALGSLSFLIIIFIALLATSKSTGSLPNINTSTNIFIKDYVNLFAGKISIIVVDIIFLYIGLFFLRQYLLYSKIVELYQCYCSLIDSEHYYDQYGNFTSDIDAEVRKKFITQIIYLADKVNDLIKEHDKTPKIKRKDFQLLNEVMKKIISK